jgi:tetratricopeptide (TPR) repeat protein
VGVDLWAADNTHLIFGPDEPRLREFAGREKELGAPLVAAAAGPDRFLLAHAVGGDERRAARLPHLVDAARYFQEEAARPGAAWWNAANLGDILAARGDTTGAIIAYERALRAEPGATRAEHHLGTVLLAAGDAPAAAAHLRRAIALDPTIPRIRFDLGLALVESGEIVEAFRLLRDGAEAAPADLAMSTVLARFLATCPDRSLRDGPGAVRIAERLRRFTRGRDARVLDTLASAYASVGRFDEARRAAEQAIVIARSRGDDAMADQIRARADLYAAGRAWF